MPCLLDVPVAGGALCHVLQPRYRERTDPAARMRLAPQKSE